MRKIDDTKDSIRVDKINDEERKKLFNDLTKAGGQVITDKPKKSMVIDRNKQREYRERLDKHQRSLTPSTAKHRKNAAGVKQNKTPNESEYHHPLTFAKNLMLRFRLRFSLRVCQARFVFFTPKFIDSLMGIYKTALLEAKVQYVDIFKKNPKEGNRIISALDKQKPLLYEVIEIAAGIIDMMPDDEDVDEIPLSDMEETIMRLYHHLSLIRPYENTLFSAYIKAIDLCRNRDVERYPNKQAQKRKIKNALHIIFNLMYRRLHWLACYYKSTYINLNDINAIENLCEILPSEKPGTMRLLGKQVTKTQQEEVNEARQQEHDEPAPSLPEHIMAGLNLMLSFDYKVMRVQFDTKGLFEAAEDNDKVLVSYLIFNEFIREYAFILNTNKIKFNSVIGKESKLHYNALMKDMYYEMNKPMAGFRNYAEVTNNYHKINKEKPINSSHYIAYSKRLQEIINKREQAGKMAKMQIRAFMEKLAEIMKTLLDDANNMREIIINPQDILKLDNSIEGKRKLNDKSIHDAIYQCYCFCSAFIYRLSINGDLYKGIEFSPEEKNSVKLLVSSLDKSSPATPSSPETSKEKAVPEEQKSLFDELSDLV